MKIGHVIERVYNGVTYGWYVADVSGRVSDGKDYCIRETNGRSVVAEYKLEWLPKQVQNFVNRRKPELRSLIGDEYASYIYRR